MTNRLDALASIAVLRVDLNRGKDYLHYVSPFFCEALSKYSVGDALSTETLQNFVQDKYGLYIPDQVARLVLKRLRSDGLKRKDTKWVLTQEFDSEGFDRKCRDAKRKVLSVCSSFGSYLKQSTEKKTTERRILRKRPSKNTIRFCESVRDNLSFQL